MSSKQRLTLLSLGASAMTAAALFALTPSSGRAAELVQQPMLAYDPAATGLPGTAPTLQPAVAVQNAQAAEDEDDAAVDPAALECMAKVVMHESGNQPRAGQVAVAQTLVNRLKSGRFGDTICEVANQRGQYFRLSAYHPSRDADEWQTAMDVSREVLSGDADTVVPGAIFFRAASHPATTFFRGRQKVAMVGAQVFYR